MFGRIQWPRYGVVVLALLLGGCATMQGHDPLNVTVAGIEPMQGEGMELRMMVKLRVQNPNDAPVEYDGVSLNIDVQGRAFASGVTAESGVVPRFGEAIVAVPITVSLMRMARQVLGVMDGKPIEHVTYDMHGKLSGASAFGTQRFSAKGELELPRPGQGLPGATSPET